MSEGKRCLVEKQEGHSIGLSEWIWQDLHLKSVHPAIKVIDFAVLACHKKAHIL